MEGDAGASRLNPTDTDDSSADVDDTAVDAMPEAAVVAEPDETVAVPDPAVPDPNPNVEAARPSRLGHGWMIGIAASLLVLAAGLGAGGYLALRSHNDTEAAARADAAAVAAAKDCVTATQAPDIAAMADSQRKIIECATGAFGAQTQLYTGSGMLVDAYKAANVEVQVSDMRAAVERHNDDGSVDVLVAVRVNVTNSASADREVGYRLRVQMAPVDGEYKIAELDVVTK